MSSPQRELTIRISPLLLRNPNSELLKAEISQRIYKQARQLLLQLVASQ